jgi:hypothetical protein
VCEYQYVFVSIAENQGSQPTLLSTFLAGGKTFPKKEYKKGREGVRKKKT